MKVLCYADDTWLYSSMKPEEPEESDFLLLLSHPTEVVVFGPELLRNRSADLIMTRGSSLCPRSDL